MSLDDSGARSTNPATTEGTTASGQLLRRVLAGAAFMIAARLVIRAMSMISILVFARLLVPEDFGLVAMAAAAIAFAEVMSVTNYAMVLVRQASVSRPLFDTAWTLNILRSILLGGLIAGTADWQAAFLGDPRIGPVLMVVALGIVIDGFTSIGMARLHRDMHFNKLFRFEVDRKLVAFSVSLVLAILLQNYWCLVLGNLAAKLFGVPYSYWLAPHAPRLSLRHAGQLLRFSGWMLAINALGTLDLHGSNLILGRIAGLPALGAFQVSYFLAAVPVHEVAVPVRQPIYAGYAQVQHDMALLRQHFLGGFGLLLTIMVPLSVGLALVAPEAARIALGPGWEHAVPLIALCALYSLVECLAAFTTNVFFVLDRLRPYVRTLAVLVAIRMPLVLAGVMLWGAVGMTAAMLATALLNLVLWHWQVSRFLGHGARALAGEAWRSIAAACAMAGVVLALRSVLPPGPTGLGLALVKLALLAAAGACTHVATQALLWHAAGRPAGPERRAFSIAGGFVQALRARMRVPSA
jgi:O-antigen/teichoic acid export membrane protein